MLVWQAHFECLKTDYGLVKTDFGLFYSRKSSLLMCIYA